MKSFPFIYNEPREFLSSLQPKEWANFFLGELNPRFSVTATKAKVIEVKEETSDSKTIVLKPNWLWKGFASGQHVPVTVEIAGRRVTRFYSLSSHPNDKYLQITVKRQKGGLVSNFINQNIKKGDILELGEASGDFVLTKELPKDLLFLAGGSGITPIHSILRSLQTLNYTGKATLLYFVRSYDDIIFKSSFDSMQKNSNWLTVHYVFSDIPKEGYASGFLSKEILETYVPNLKSSSVYVCGPSPMQTKALSLLEGLPVKSELFLLPGQNVGKVKKEGTVDVFLTLSHKTIQVKGERSILEELEEQGIYPQSGCRMGICHTCVCKKQTGSITDLSNGETSQLGEENIQICVSRAESNLELEL
ncbi:Flavodoxin reductase [Leptospira biflexa serovar Patoc strain 'Patoc 1 (Ames)']|uniref:Putative ferredoxin--NAD(+) reductase n=1 Tax=Leptospira biflexa serovar Patoc (strain Patoc 1 / ATCC 23582 / Paris) TaxID=456481 RepID=B0SQ19_LEPBP|nr:iron-sulfur cluster-binding domain-containing protein [Leptospira biflexa]ABZ95466.1 Flavodoxin reductase [Leptospira biflexa serovar Patoc strain 'Patoc 1 (Ames)']ABZ99171.1 Putative ferredoxin--NAD(+) reductase [Leptospira biflexa serovar Patoc strain 'Patoc 1 (Paris)']